MRLQAVIFDMDGVLIDSEPIHYAVLSVLLASDGFESAPEEYEEFIGTTSETMFMALVKRHGLAHSVTEYLSLYDDAILRAMNEPHTPQPGVKSLLSAMRALGLRCALASSSRRSWIGATLRSIGLSEAFEVIVSGDDVTHSKPDPEIYTLAALRLQVPASDCVAIEDSPNGVTSARRAGMPVIGVRTRSTAHLPLEGTLCTVDSLEEVDLLKLLGGKFSMSHIKQEGFFS